MSKNLTKRSEDYSKWYNELVLKADLAENSSVRGCMVIKPYGFAIWEKIPPCSKWRIVCCTNTSACHAAVCEHEGEKTRLEGAEIDAKRHQG